MARAAAQAANSDTLLRNRLENSIGKIISAMPQAAKAAAIASADLSQFVTEIARGVPVFHGAEEAELKEQQLSAIRFKREAAQAAGGLLDVEDVQALLGHRTKQAVYKAAQEHRLLGVEDGGRQRFPACQFDGTRVRPGVQAILKAAPETSGWRILQYLFGREEGLGGARPIDLVKGSVSDIERAARFARRLET